METHPKPWDIETHPKPEDMETHPKEFFWLWEGSLFFLYSDSDVLHSCDVPDVSFCYIFRKASQAQKVDLKINFNLGKNPKKTESNFQFVLTLLW